MDANIPALIKDIHKTGVPLKNVLIVSGHENNDSVGYIDGIKVVKVKYTGLHMTSFIYIKENLDQYTDEDYFIMLPDTIKVGAKFYNNIVSYMNNLNNTEKILVVPFINPKIRPTMDMGIVSKHHIIDFAEYLDGIKTFDLDKNFNKDKIFKCKNGSIKVLIPDWLEIHS